MSSKVVTGQFVDLPKHSCTKHEDGSRHANITHNFWLNLTVPFYAAGLFITELMKYSITLWKTSFRIVVSGYSFTPFGFVSFRSSSLTCARWKYWWAQISRNWLSLPISTPSDTVRFSGFPGRTMLLSQIHQILEKVWKHGAFSDPNYYADTQ